jgi:hypothetical protein
MATISDVIIKFITEPDKITDIAQATNEYYFRYAGFAFSLALRTTTNEINKFGRHSLYVYPAWRSSILELVKASAVGGPEDIDAIAYHEISMTSTVLQPTSNLQRYREILTP